MALPPLPERVTIPLLVARKTRQQPIVMVTAYDAPTARLADAAGVDALLVGDSVGMTTLGYDTTLPVTLDDIVRHTQAVARGAAYRTGCPSAAPTPQDTLRGARHALIIADLPFGSYGISAEEGARNGCRLVAQAGAQAVKVEGASAIVLETIQRLVDLGVPTMGHLGLTPQSIHRFGGFKLQGKTEAAADALLANAHALVAAGVFGIVLEVIPAALARRVTDDVAVPTIGIGAGVGCDGQVQVLHDLVGLPGDGPVFKHARRYAEAGEIIAAALTAYTRDVREKRFPSDENAF